MRRLRGDSGTGHGDVTHDELLKVQLTSSQLEVQSGVTISLPTAEGAKSGQFPDEFVKIEGTQIHCVTSRTYQQR